MLNFVKIFRKNLKFINAVKNLKLDTRKILKTLFFCFSLGYRVNKCVSLLEQLLKEHRLVDIIWTECIVDNKKHRLEEQFHQELITAIVSLPSKTANKLKDQNR